MISPILLKIVGKAIKPLVILATGLRGQQFVKVACFSTRASHAQPRKTFDGFCGML